MQLSGDLTFEKGMFEWIRKTKDDQKVSIIIDNDGYEMCFRFDETALKELGDLIKKYFEQGGCPEESLERNESKVKMDSSLALDSPNEKNYIKLEANIDDMDFHRVCFTDEHGNKFGLIVGDPQIIAIHPVLESYINAQKAIEDLKKKQNLQKQI